MIDFKRYFITLMLFGIAYSCAFCQVAYQDKDQVFLEIYKHIKASESNGIARDYFKIADAQMFYEKTKTHCNGVVVDRGYLASSELVEGMKRVCDHAYKMLSEWEISEINPGILGLYQPSGWTGIAQAIGSSYEMKYNGYLILADEVGKSNMSTVFHEAIHCFAEATGRTDLDEDKYDGPGFYSDTFLKIIKKLSSNEKHLQDITTELSMGHDQSVELKLFWSRHENARKDFFKRTDVTTFGIPLEKVMQVSGDLHKVMGGMADWDGYEGHINRLIDEAGERGKLASKTEPIILKGEELKISSIQCPVFSNSYELRSSQSFGEEVKLPGQVDVYGTLNKTHSASCKYAVRGREFLSFSIEVHWMESSDGLHNWCNREVGNSSFSTKYNDVWRGPYTPIFPFGVTADQIYAHQEVIAKIVITQYEKGFIRSYLGWSEIIEHFEDLFNQVTPHALPCEKKE